MLIWFDDDIKESVKVINVPKCDFFQNFSGEHAPGPLEGLKSVFLQLHGSRKFLGSTPPPKQKILDNKEVCRKSLFVTLF